MIQATCHWCGQLFLAETSGPSSTRCKYCQDEKPVDIPPKQTIKLDIREEKEYYPECHY